MGMYCACGVKKRREGWKCECDWNCWNLCFELDSAPKNVPINPHPDKEGIYEVRTFGDGDYHEEESKYSLVEKNWGKSTNQAISRWEIEYNDNRLGYTGVYAWKKK